MPSRPVLPLRPIFLALALASSVVSTAAVACASGTSEAEGRSYEVDGTVRRVDREARTITIAHEDVPGYMPAMTMPFSVDDARLMDGLAEGDRVRFRFVAAGGGRHVIATIRKL